MRHRRNYILNTYKSRDSNDERYKNFQSYDYSQYGQRLREHNSRNEGRKLLEEGQRITRFINPFITDAREGDPTPIATTSSDTSHTGWGGFHCFYTQVCHAVD